MRAVEKRLRERIKELENKLQVVENDRRLFREHFVNRFKFLIQVLGENKNPCAKWLIEDDAAWLQEFEKWYW